MKRPLLMRLGSSWVEQAEAEDRLQTRREFCSCGLWAERNRKHIHHRL